MALFPGLPGWAGTRKLKPIWILLKQETMSGSGISWAICKSAPHSRQTTTQFFTGRTPLLLLPSQVRQSTEGTSKLVWARKAMSVFTIFLGIMLLMGAVMHVLVYFCFVRQGSRTEKKFLLCNVIFIFAGKPLTSCGKPLRLVVKTKQQNGTKFCLRQTKNWTNSATNCQLPLLRWVVQSAR